MSSFKLTGLAAGSVAGDSVRFEQLLGLGSIGTARQVPTVNAGATALAFQNPITLATPQASTSGTAINFTSIPAGVRRITINLVGVSTNGTDNYYIQIGGSGGIETSGYLGAGGLLSASPSYGTSTAAFLIVTATAAAIVHGSIILSLENASTNTWVCSAMLGRSDSAVVMLSGGSKSTSTTLDRVRITTVNGTDTFDAGEINISYE